MGQIEVCPQILRIELYGPAVVVDGLVQLPLVAQNVAEVVVCRHVTRVEFNRFAIVIGCQVGIVLEPHGCADRTVAHCGLRSAGERRPVIGGGFVGRRINEGIARDQVGPEVGGIRRLDVP